MRAFYSHHNYSLYFIDVAINSNPRFYLSTLCRTPLSTSEMGFNTTLTALVVLSILHASTLTNGQPLSELDDQEREVDRTKRAIPAIIIWLAGAIAGAVVGTTYEDIVRFGTEIRSNECGVFIVWALGPNGFDHPAVDMNFKSKYEDNWNNERLDPDPTGPKAGGYFIDKTRERVDGGELKLIQFWWKHGKKACIRDLAFTCGEQVTGVGLKSVLLTRAEFSIRAGWQGKVSYVDFKHGEPCTWFSHDYENIRAIDLYPGIFSCGKNDAHCKASHMQLFIN
jgi:hypothetical protein